MTVPTTPLASPGGTADLAGHTVARIGFGAMQLPGPGVLGPPRDRDQAVAVLRRAVELGVNHIDTAQFYGPDVANELIHAALHPYFPLGSAFPGLPKVTENPAVIAVATDLGATPAQIGLAWLLAHDPHTLLIPGTSHLGHLEENLATGAVHLDAATMVALDAI